MFNYWIQPGRVQVAFLGAAQVDRHANLNSTVIGDYAHPKTRLPGAGGAPEIATGCAEVVVIAPHSPRTFVEQLDFRTTTGRRTTAVITDLGVLEPDGGELTLTQLHPGVSVEQVREQTGWDTLRVADEPRVTPEPTREELDGARGAARPMSAAYVYDAVRTPFGRFGGGLSGVRPDDLAAHVVGALVERAPALEPERIDDVLFGNANGAGEDNRDVARMAVLLAGLPTSVPGTSINRLCGSSLDAAMQASRAVEAGDASLDARRRRRVDVARAVGRAQAREGAARGRRDAALHDARLAHGQSAHAGPVDDLARREHGEARRDPRDHARAAGRVRAAQPPRHRGGVGRRLL